MLGCLSIVTYLCARDSDRFGAVHASLALAAQVVVAIGLSFDGFVVALSVLGLVSLGVVWIAGAWRARGVLVLALIPIGLLGALAELARGVARDAILADDTYLAIVPLHAWGAYLLLVTCAVAQAWSQPLLVRTRPATLSRIGAGLFSAGALGIIAMFAWLGYGGMPRRYADHLPLFDNGFRAATLAAWVMTIGLAMLLVSLLRGARR